MCSIWQIPLLRDAGVVRLTLTGRPQRHWHILRDREIWTEKVAAMAQDSGKLWLDKLLLEIDAPEQRRRKAAPQPPS